MAKLAMRLEHGFGCILMRPEHDVDAPSMQKVVVPASFPAFLMGKSHVFSQTPVRSSYYKY